MIWCGLRAVVLHQQRQFKCKSQNLPRNAWSDVRFETSFNFGTRKYVVQTTPTAAYIALHRGWQGWAVLAARALSTGLLGGRLLLRPAHAHRLQRLAAQSRDSLARGRSVFWQTSFAVAHV